MSQFVSHDGVSRFYFAQTLEHKPETLEAKWQWLHRHQHHSTDDRGFDSTYAVDVKFWQMQFSSEEAFERAYELATSDLGYQWYTRDLRRLIYEFEIDHPGYTISLVGRSGGWFVLIDRMGQSVAEMVNDEFGDPSHEETAGMWFDTVWDFDVWVCATVQAFFAYVESIEIVEEEIEITQHIRFVREKNVEEEVQNGAKH